MLCRRHLAVVPLGAPLLLVALAARGDAPVSAAAPSQPALTLQRAVELALKSNEQGQIAELRVESAEARIDKARSFFLPDVNLTGTWTHHVDAEEPIVAGARAPERNQLDARLAIIVTLFDGRGFPLYGSAEHERDAQRFEAAETRRTLAFDTASTFLATLSQERVEEAARTRLALAERNHEEAKRRFEAGLVSSNDVTQVELERAAAERDLTSARAEIAQRRLELGFLVVREVSEPLEHPATLLAQAEAAGLARPESLRTRDKPLERLDVAALEARALAQDELAEEPLWRWVPTLSLTGAQAMSVRPDDPFDTTIALTLSWALWDGGERSADRSERLANAAAARHTALARLRSARVEVERAMVALQRGARVLSQAARTADVARRNGTETTELYRQGLGTAFAVADANGRLFAAEVELARARYDLAESLLSLRRALGLDPFGSKPRP